MTNAMLKIINQNKEEYFTTCAKESSNSLRDYLKNECDVKAEVFEILPFEELPKDVQFQVKSTLRVYNECSVIYEYGRFTVSTGICIKVNYNYDYMVCGYYKSEEIYTPEERKQNFIEEFGY